MENKVLKFEPKKQRNNARKKVYAQTEIIHVDFKNKKVVYKETKFNIEKAA